jgi:carbon monoxide dehydrogenase subunit G
MKVAIAIERSIDIPAPYAKVQTQMRDLETTIRRFPKLRNLRKLGDQAYVWEMEPVGSRIANISHEVVYGAKYKVDLDRGLVSWTPIADQGNAAIGGAFRLQDLGGKTKLSFDVKGELRDVPVPFMYRLLAPAFIQMKFTRLVEIFLERTAAAAGMDPQQVAAARRSAA